VEKQVVSPDGYQHISILYSLLINSFAVSYNNLSPQDVSTLIIGAGPAGLATAAALRMRQQNFVMLESGSHVGASWYKHYRRLQLHTIKELSYLPGMHFPNFFPQYVTRALLLEYFENYAAQFDIRPVFRHCVSGLSRQADGRWLVKVHHSRSYLCEQVVIATGVNHTPNIPAIESKEKFTGKLIHSSVYKEPTPFAGQRVLVVGMGNSGAEIALDLSEAGIDTSISVRGPVNIVPREVFGRPTQQTALLLAKLPTWLGDRIGLLVRKLTMGDLQRYGLPLADMAPAKQLRELGQTPVIDLGTADQIRQGRIKILPGISHFEPDQIVFGNGQRQPFDTVIFATGYRAKLDELLGTTEGLCDAQGLPVSIVGSDAYEGLYFVGFDNYSPGGGLSIIRRDSVRVAQYISERMARSQGAMLAQPV
jgi:cation diffusion facilitator CzcD-associated flavoprotein CzcO